MFSLASLEDAWKMQPYNQWTLSISTPGLKFPNYLERLESCVRELNYILRWSIIWIHNGIIDYYHCISSRTESTSINFLSSYIQIPFIRREGGNPIQPESYVHQTFISSIINSSISTVSNSIPIMATGKMKSIFLLPKLKKTAKMTNYLEIY